MGSVMDLEETLERHRVGLTGYCYRMLGSGFEAEDAVQETFIRAWRRSETFRADQGAFRTWLYAIATNVCIDMLRSSQRRARAMDLGPATTSGAPLGEPLPEGRWIQPVPDDRVIPDSSDPAELAAQRETIRLAFVVALQHLPPRQRAVLILREVLCWKADEVAALLETTSASVNSALQRARATIASERPTATATATVDPMDEEQRKLLTRYAQAFDDHDVEALIALLHEDATTSMPPFVWWLRGSVEIARTLRSSDACQDARLLPARANGGPAFGQYRPTGPDGEFVPFALVTLETSGGLVTETTTFLCGPVGERMFTYFGLPASLPPLPHDG